MLARWVPWVLGVVLLTACGYRNAISRAEQAKSEKDWASAAAAYEAALEHDPEDPIATAALADVRRRWHVQSMSRFEKSLKVGDLAAAEVALRQAESARPEAEVNRTAAARLESANKAKTARQLRADGARFLAAQQIDQALKAVVEAQRLHPTPAGAQAVDQAVAAIVARSERREAAGKWALAHFDRTIVESHRPAGAAERAALRARWIAAWDADAQAHEGEGRLASAYVRATQLARLDPERAEFATRRDALRARLMVPLLMRRETAFTGDGPRLRGMVARLPTPRSHNPDSPALTLRGRLAPVRCAQTERVKARARKYVAGTRTVRNPDWTEARQSARRARRERVDTERRQHDADQAVWRAERELAEKQRRIAERRRRKRRQLRQDLERARDEEQRCQDALSRADRNQQSSARSRLDRASRAVRDAWEALDRFASADHGAEQAWRELESARERLEDARRESERARERENDAERRVDGVEPTTEVPRYATHRYPVSHWTRTCSATLSVTVDRAGAPPETVELSADASTRDTAHAVQVVLGLDANPLRFPKNDRALSAQVDDALAEALRRLVQDQRRQWTRGLVKAATDAERSREERIRHAVGAVLSGSQDGLIHALLLEQFDLGKPGALR